VRITDRAHSAGWCLECRAWRPGTTATTMLSNRSMRHDTSPPDHPLTRVIDQIAHRLPAQDPISISSTTTHCRRSSTCRSRRMSKRPLREDIALDLGEPEFDMVQPRRIGGGKVELHTWVGRETRPEPSASLRAV
jgi:hypothetical protein